MLKRVDRMGKLPFGKLMEVYREGNEENGLEFWPEEPPQRRIALAEEAFYQFLREIFFLTPGAQYLLWEMEGAPVSALRLEPYRDGLLISALESAPEHREKGYATALLQAVCRTYAGTKLYSHVGKINGPSLRVHQKAGFQVVLSHAVYLDGSVNDRCYTLVRE